MSSKAGDPATAVKFHSLPIGERFRWQGAQYVKVSPLIAREEVSGRSQLIQRAARVEPLDAQAVARSAEAAGTAQTALEEYHQTALACLQELAQHAPRQTVEPLRQRLDEAHRRALKKLRGKGR